jgi:transposase InsO family protein
MKLNDLHTRLKIVLDYLDNDKTANQVSILYGIKPRTVRKLAKLYRDGGIEALRVKPRTPRSQPLKTPGCIEDLIIQTKLEHPSYGSRMIKHTIKDRAVISHTTITKILKRYNLLYKVKPKVQPCKRFERKHPDSLWQMDIYEFRIAGIGKCYIFSIVDDHSRYICCLRIFAKKTLANAIRALNSALAKGRIPDSVYVDNGKQFIGRDFREFCLDSGIKLIVGRPFNPRARGKVEGFHKILHKELINQVWFRDLNHAQDELDKFRDYYNNKRPQGGIGYNPPVSRYLLAKVS